MGVMFVLRLGIVVLMTGAEVVSSAGFLQLSDIAMTFVVQLPRTLFETLIGGTLSHASLPALLYPCEHAQ